jgi:hypothetical protein
MFLILFFLVLNRLRELVSSEELLMSEVIQSETIINLFEQKCYYQ